VRLAGTLHVSLPTDILQFFGPGSVPFVVGGFVYAVFELGEKLASQRAKDALSKWLLTFDVKKAGALPDGRRQEHCPMVCKSYLRGFSVSVTFR
jgi:hypothetical protein